MAASKAAHKGHMRARGWCRRGCRGSVERGWERIGKSSMGLSQRQHAAKDPLMHSAARWPWRGSPGGGGGCVRQSKAALAAAHGRLRIGVHGFSPAKNLEGYPCPASTTEAHIGGNRRDGTGRSVIAFYAG